MTLKLIKRPPSVWNSRRDYAVLHSFNNIIVLWVQPAKYHRLLALVAFQDFPSFSFQVRGGIENDVTSWRVLKTFRQVTQFLSFARFFRRGILKRKPMGLTLLPISGVEE